MLAIVRNLIAVGESINFNTATNEELALAYSEILPPNGDRKFVSFLFLLCFHWYLIIMQSFLAVVWSFAIEKNSLWCDRNDKSLVREYLVLNREN